MATYEHTRIAGEIRNLDAVPEDGKAYDLWIRAGGHLDLLRKNARSNEVVLYANGEYTFIYAAVVPNEALKETPEEERLTWDGGPYNSFASYTYGGGRDDVWIERQGEPDNYRRVFDKAIPLVFVRTFEGWTGTDRVYVELNPLFTHVTGIHWRRERRAYCRYDENGDLEDVVSVTMRSDAPNDLNCVTVAWEPLERFLAAMKATLVRRFDFTLLRRGAFGGWSNDLRTVNRESEHLIYNQVVMPSHAAYTSGIQLLPLRRDASAVFEEIRKGRRNRQYADFIAMDWRNKRIAKLSTAPGATTNYFQARENSLAFELSPAFFRPEVVLKYKGDKDKYTVKERDIHCRAAWYLQAFDVNEAGQVFAYLCYLRNLPYEEQLHWQGYNEAPKAGISQRAITNDFEGEFTTFRDPLQEVLSIIRSWRDSSVRWWTLRDERLLERVSTPLTASRDEWGDAFLELSKLVVEGFEVSKIRAALDAAKVPYDKEQSIGLLELLLGGNGAAGPKRRLEGLRTLQSVRTKAKGHASSDHIEALVHDVLSKHGSFSNHFKHVCSQIALELQQIAGALQ